MIMKFSANDRKQGLYYFYKIKKVKKELNFIYQPLGVTVP